jgi:hypothetical protein
MTDDYEKLVERTARKREIIAAIVGFNIGLGLMLLMQGDLLGLLDFICAAFLVECLAARPKEGQ